MKFGIIDNDTYNDDIKEVMADDIMNYYRVKNGKDPILHRRDCDIIDSMIGWDYYQNKGWFPFKRNR